MKTENITCPFCKPDREFLKETDLAFAMFDKFPVNKGHVLIIPKNHQDDFFSLPENVQIDCIALLNKMKEYLQATFNPDGYNVGINIGKAAGQTIGHVHIHLIPRYTKDVENPSGGVRGVIPNKKEY
ncbi:MAG: HIT family protein [Ferruginibacter sp.]